MGSITVYADVLFLVNFSMDFLTLYLTGRLTGKTMRRRNLLLAAGVGGAVGTLLLAVRAPERLTVLLGLLLSVGITRIAFGAFGQRRRLLRDSLIVWGAGALLGGIMTFVMSLGQPTAEASGARFPEAFALCFGIALLLTRLTKTARGQKSLPVSAEADGITLHFEALCDSGSFAADPMTGLPAILVRREALGELMPLLEREDCPLRLRLIPVDSVGGSRLLRGFIPDRLFVNGKEESAVLAECGESAFAGYDALLPSVLCGTGDSVFLKKTEEKSCSSEHPC